MGSFAFRIRFHMPPHRSISCDADELAIPIAGTEHNLLLKSVDANKPIKSAHRLVLEGGPYKSAEDAWDAGQRARKTLILYALMERIGFALGKNQAVENGVTLTVDSRSKDKDPQELKDIHGLMVYDTSKEPRFSEVCSLKVVMGAKISRLKDFVGREFVKEFKLSEKEELSFELFSTSQLEVSPRSQFLTLFVAIEVLTRKPNQKFVGQTVRMLNEKHLRQTRYDGQNPVEFFKHCNQLRDQLVHKGRLKDDSIDLKAKAKLLEQFVADLLDALIRANEKA